MKIKPTIFFLVIGFVACLIIYKDPSATHKVTVGAIAPDFTLPDKERKQVHLSQYRGKLVFLNFWATNCLPCVREMPSMHALNQILEDQPFQMLAVSTDLDWESVTAFYERLGIDVPTLLDPGRQAFSRFQLTGQPETFIISADGVILNHTIGEREWSNPKSVAFFKALMTPAVEQRTSKEF